LLAIQCKFFESIMFSFVFVVIFIVFEFIVLVFIVIVGKSPTLPTPW